MTTACSVRVRGVVQGVGFRPFVYRLAHAHALTGWVVNRDDGVEIHVEGPDNALRRFLRDLNNERPPAALIAAIDIRQDEPAHLQRFSDPGQSGPADGRRRASLRISLSVSRASVNCSTPNDRRYHYPYINCTNCGPRYTVIQGLPYDRSNTTMRSWPLDEACAAEYADPADRRFHAQPVACPRCGPQYELIEANSQVQGSEASVTRAAQLLACGHIVAVKGLGGYHLACDARNAESVCGASRTRKFRKEKPFALMVANLETARRLVALSPDAEALLMSTARPIVLAPAHPSVRVAGRRSRLLASSG